MIFLQLMDGWYLKGLLFRVHTLHVFPVVNVCLEFVTNQKGTKAGLWCSTTILSYPPCCRGWDIIVSSGWKEEEKERCSFCMQVDCLSMCLVWFRQVARGCLEINLAPPPPPPKQPQLCACCQATAAAPLPFPCLHLKQGLYTLFTLVASHQTTLLVVVVNRTACQWV